jgi:UDPglucose 6-dehydrogenase
MRIAVLGTGYVGLVTGACLAESGNEVLNADIDEAKIATLRDGRVPFYEPGLEELVERNARNGRLSFSTDVADCIRRADTVFVAVGTPPGEDGAANLSYVFNAVRTVVCAAQKSMVVVMKSTVPVGTGKKVQALLDERTDIELEAASNPEFLREGSAIRDFTDPDRIVVGTSSEGARETLHAIYAPTVRAAPSNEAQILDMDVASAEMTKYAANAMLATRISFMNELAHLCASVGADSDLVREGIGTDPRIGPRFLNAGIGYGGSCFPKDVQAMIAVGKEHDVPFQVLEAVHDVNEKQKFVLTKMVRDFFGDDLSGRTFGVWGLAFKPNTDDMREAPSVVVINGLLEAGATVRAYDPIAYETAREVLGDSIEYVENSYDALDGADALLLLTEWGEFRVPDFAKVKSKLRHPVVFDGRNVYRIERMREEGFTYFSIGRPSVRQHDPKEL